MDHRHLRLHDRGAADHDGNPGRSDWPPSPADDGSGSFWWRVGASSVLDQREYAHRRSCAARRCRGDPHAIHHVTDSQYVSRPQSADGRHRRLGFGFLGRQRDWPAGRWAAAGIFFMGIGLPAGRAGAGGAADSRAEAAAGIQRSQSRALRPAQRWHVAGRRAAGNLRSEAVCGEWSGLAADVVGRDWSCRWFRLRAQTADPHRSADRPAAVPRSGLQRFAGDLHLRHLRRAWNWPLRRTVPATGAWAVAVTGRFLVSPWRVHLYHWL